MARDRDLRGALRRDGDRVPGARWRSRVAALARRDDPARACDPERARAGNLQRRGRALGAARVGLFDRRIACRQRRGLGRVRGLRGARRDRRARPLRGTRGTPRRVAARESALHGLRRLRALRIVRRARAGCGVADARALPVLPGFRLAARVRGDRGGRALVEFPCERDARADRCGGGRRRHALR